MLQPFSRARCKKFTGDFFFGIADTRGAVSTKRRVYVRKRPEKKEIDE